MRAQDCSRRPETDDSMKRKRECLQAAFKDGSTPSETRRYSQYNEDGIIDAIFSCILTHDRCAHCRACPLPPRGDALQTSTLLCDNRALSSSTPRVCNEIVHT